MKVGETASKGDVEAFGRLTSHYDGKYKTINGLAAIKNYVTASD
jgi:hypothetical protein